MIARSYQTWYPRRGHEFPIQATCQGSWHSRFAIMCYAAATCWHFGWQWLAVKTQPKTNTTCTCSTTRRSQQHARAHQTHASAWTGLRFGPSGRGPKEGDSPYLQLVLQLPSGVKDYLSKLKRNPRTSCVGAKLSNPSAVKAELGTRHAEHSSMWDMSSRVRL